MKEVFTKSFWQSVQKTFQEALEDAPPADKGVATRAGGEPSPSSTSETAAPSSVESEQR